MSKPVGPRDRSEGAKSPSTESKLATQVPSAGGLISQYGSVKLYFENVPVLGGIERYFAQRTAKQKLMKLIQSSFPNNDLKSILSEFNLENLASIQKFITHLGTFIFPKHTNATREWLQALNLALEIVQSPELSQTFKFVTDKFNQASFEEKYRFAEALVATKKVLSQEQWILACKALNTYLKEKPNYLIDQKSFPLIRVYFEVGALMGGRLEERHYRTFLDELFKFSKTPEFATGLQHFQTFLDTVKKVQLERPKIHSAVEKAEFYATWMQAQPFFAEDDYSFIQNLFNEIGDQTAVLNHQTLKEAIESFYFREKPSPLEYGYLQPRIVGSDISLLQELKQGIVLKENDEIVHFSGEFELLVTNPRTEETRSTTFHLPISGEMTQKEAIAYLKFLVLLMESPEKIVEGEKNIELTPTQKAHVKEKFLNWWKKSEKQFAQLLFDFNATSRRGLFAFAKEQREVAASLKQPRSISKALAAANGSSIYLVGDHKLSLLPPEVAQFHPRLGGLTPGELEKAKEALGKKSFGFALEVPQDTTMNLRTETVMIRGSRFAKLEVTIKFQDEMHTRTTYYPLLANEQLSDFNRRLTSSRRFERDLLLAKGEYFKRHA